MRLPMSDADILSQFMEPRPALPPDRSQRFQKSLEGWWEAGRVRWHPIFNTCSELKKLGYCHMIEERLAEDQQWQYIEVLRRQIDRGVQNTAGTWHFLHATAEQKTKALAQVIGGGK